MRNALGVVMSHQLIMARQPILDLNGEIFGYEFFYRNDKGNADASDPRLATSSVLVNILNQVGVQSSVGDAKAFINVSANILLTDILYSLPTGIFVFELSENMLITNKEIESIRALHAMGFEFALDNVSFNEEYFKNFSPVFPYITYAKFDTMMTDIELLTEKIDRFKNFILIAQKVEFLEVHEAYKELGFSYFQGYYFAKPHLIQKNRLDPKHMGVIRIFNLLQSDAPMDQICTEFERHNELTMQLLQFLNSTSTFEVRDINSIRHVIELVGKKNLLQWLLMIIYSKSAKNIKSDKSPLSIMVQNRIDIMLGILEKAQPLEIEKLSEQARLTAMLSLLEALFDVPLAVIFQSFDVDDAVKEALLSHSGKLGRLYALALAIEKQDFAATQVLLKSFNLHIDDISDMLDKSLRFA
jgi:EAL and modified HD-GYP domain-containing signal transduction protein